MPTVYVSSAAPLIQAEGPERALLWIGGSSYYLDIN